MKIQIKRALTTGLSSAAGVCLLSVALPAAAHAVNVDHERVILAAQLDPSSSAFTPDAKDDVIRVQKALVKVGLLSSTLVDGDFGRVTTKAYRRWEERLGHGSYRTPDGVLYGLNGIPGVTSLRELLSKTGDTLIREVVRGDIIKRNGQEINERTNSMLAAAEKLIGGGCKLVVTQGSYNPGGVAASGGTHDGGGAVDISTQPANRCGKTQREIVRQLRTVGFAAWHRLPNSQWPDHIHAIAISDADLSNDADDGSAWLSAREQVWRYRNNRNGLSSDAPDEGPDVTFRTFEQYKRTL